MPFARGPGSPTRTSPTRTSARKQSLPSAFRTPLRPKSEPISQMSGRALHDLHARNARILAEPGASTSTYVQRVSAEQTAIEQRLLELEGIPSIQNQLHNTRLRGEDDMDVVDDSPPEEPMSRTLDAKRRALSRFGPKPAATHQHNTVGSLTMAEAISLEQRAHAADLERKQAIIDKKTRLGLPLDGQHLTRAEKEARMWAFMNHKPSDSDLEDDSDDEDEDPATWFDGYEDEMDGIKGQDIVEPDIDDLLDVIRVDHSKVESYSTFYEPRHEGD